MRGTKILAFACSMIVAWNQIPISVVPTYAIEEDEIKSVTVEANFVESMTVYDKEYDGTTTAEIDLSNVKLIGIDTGDDVTLTAKAVFDDANAGDAKNVQVSDFELIGDDKDKYTLNLEPNFQIVTKTAKISPAIIHLTPVGTFVEGEKLPKEIEYNINQNDIKANDNVNVTAIVSISVDENNVYIYQIDDATATGNANYILAMQEDSTPTPSSPSAATLSSASIDRAGASYLEQYDFGIVANGAVKITLNAELSHDMPVKFILSDGQEVIDDSPRFYSRENIYRASGEFIVELAESETFKDISLSATIENGDQSSTVDLPLKLNGNNSTSHLIIDNKPTSVSSLTLKNHGLEGEHYFDAKGVFVDGESGIRSIRYRWDNDVKSANWINYENFSHNPGDKVDFYVKTDWNNSTDPRSVRPDGSHKLELEITDNAGNVYRDGGNLITDGADTKAPQPTYIRLDKTTETTWDKIVNILSFGTFVNQKLVLSLKVEDRTETEQSSGVKSVALTDGKGEDEKVIAADIKSSDGAYTYSMEPDQIISSWYLKLTDYNGNTEYFLIRDLLNSDIAKEPVEETTTSEDGEEETTTTTTGMDWSQLKSDKSGMWIFDKTVPVVTPDYSDGILEDGVYYYSDGTFTLKCTDNAALQSISIKKSYRLTDADEWTSLTPYTMEFNKITTEDVFTLETKSLKNGWYRFDVSIIDGAQNKNASSLSTFEIYVDHAKPEGKISVISPSAPNYLFQENDDTYWVRERDADEKYLPITFRVDATPKGAKLRAIKVEVFGGNGNSRTFEFKKNDIIEEDGTFYVTALVSADPSSKDYLQLSESNTYDVKAVVEAASHNTSDEIHYTLHVDTETPVVESFSVERKNTAAETILNVLTFGAFANDSLKLTVKVKDGQNDIGLDHVDISYTNTNGESVKTTLTEESAGVYTCELALDTKVFQSDIVVTAYDKLNKSSKNAPNIQNTTGDKHTKDGNTFVMLEAEAPTLKVILPSSDSSKRDDGQIWYRQHSDTTEDDAFKYIEVAVKDDASGIQRINMLINGQPIDHLVDEASQNAIITDIERDNTKILDFDSTRAMGELDRASLCDEFHYYYSTESIADKIQANADGSYVITFEITDNAGNVTTAPVDENGNLYADEKVVYYRDIVAPNVTQFIFDPASFDNISEVNQEDFIQKLEYGYYFKTAFDVMLTSVDPEPPSGLDYAVFRMVPYENGELKPEIISDPIPFSNGVAKYSIPKGFKGQIYGKAYDKVSNVSEERTPQGFVIDETVPTITIQELPENPAGKDANGNNIYTNSISIRVTISDTQSGLRTISYSKDSELDKYDDFITGIPNDAGTGDNKVLDNGWEITGTDVNLVTEVSKVFTFDKDDNDIKMTFKATDRSGNECDPKSSGTFTIDTIAPQIAISNSSSLLNGLYYNGSTEYSITVTERNFSQELIIANIKNEFTNATPTISFTSNGNSTHTAKVSFPEGDYSFSLSGTDLGGHKATISYNGAEANEYFFTSFNVDATKPKIQTNFKSFGADENEAVYFNKQQTAEIIVTEHNFADSDMGISVKRKGPGTTHIVGGDGWSEIGYSSNWKDDGDKHTLTIKFDKDGVYRITMAPKRSCWKSW
ncbi:MAG TPA: YDG domain-containing protein [Ruminococcus sp.]|nr:YDG domain-containing protein [Ruminococcus sp.]